MVQWLRAHAPLQGAQGLISGQEAKIPHAAGYGQKKKKITGICSFFSPSLWLNYSFEIVYLLDLFQFVFAQILLVLLHFEYEVY